MTTFLEDQKLVQHEINKEMKDSYIDYAMKRYRRPRPSRRKRRA